MKKYRVLVVLEEHYRGEIHVEANSEDEARRKVEDRVNDAVEDGYIEELGLDCVDSDYRVRVLAG
jgi:DNA-dependent RNA polymerase auxiliary subunit epsilon